MNYQNFSADTFYLHSAITFEGMPRVVDNRQLLMQQTGWTVAPQVKWEFLKYGNMHFHLLLQGNVTTTGYRRFDESFNTPFRNNGEYLEMPQTCDSLKTFSWGVSLRPTLTYEFSTHLSAELSLDFLSVGYVDARQTDDHLRPHYDNEGDLPRAHPLCRLEHPDGDPPLGEPHAAPGLQLDVLICLLLREILEILKIITDFQDLYGLYQSCEITANPFA